MFNKGRTPPGAAFVFRRNNIVAFPEGAWGFSPTNELLISVGL